MWNRFQIRYILFFLISGVLLFGCVPETRKPNWSQISSLLSTIINISYVRRYGFF